MKYNSTLSDYNPIKIISEWVLIINFKYSDLVGSYYFKMIIYSYRIINNNNNYFRFT